MKISPFVTLTFLLSAGQATATSVNYTNFSSTAGLTLNGGAAQAGAVLRVVPSADTQSGTAFLTAPISFSSTTGFSNAFEFIVTTASVDPTDGFTFLLQNDAAGAGALGAGGQGMGMSASLPAWPWSSRAGTLISSASLRAVQTRRTCRHLLSLPATTAAPKESSTTRTSLRGSTTTRSLIS